MTDPAATLPARVIELCATAAGGVRTHVLECSRLLAAQGHEVLLLAPPGVVADADTGSAHTRTLDLGPRPSRHDLPALARLRRLARHADVVHAHGLRAGALAGLALGPRRPERTRLVVTLHNLTIGSPLTRATGELLERVVARRADQVLAVSPDLADRARRRGAVSVQIAVVPAPTPRGPQPTGPSAPSPWDPGRARVLTVARLAPQKGLDLLLDAAGILGSAEDLPADPQWALAGDGPLAPALHERIEAEHLPVRLLGARSDITSLMSQADVVVQTSLWEGQPLTIQETLRAGAPLVATDVGGTAVTARAGAVLVPPQAPAIAGAVHTLLTDPRARRLAASRSREAASRLPSCQDLATQLADVLLAGHAAPPEEQR